MKQVSVPGPENDRGEFESYMDDESSTQCEIVRIRFDTVTWLSKMCPNRVVYFFVGRTGASVKGIKFGDGEIVCPSRIVQIDGCYKP